MDNKEKRKRLEQIIDGLPTKTKTLIRRRYVQRMPFDAIGKSDLFKFSKGGKVSRQWVFAMLRAAEEKLGRTLVDEIRQMYPEPVSESSVKRALLDSRAAVLRFLKRLPADKPINYHDAYEAVGLKPTVPRAQNPIGERESCKMFFDELGLRLFVRYKICGYKGLNHIERMENFYTNKEGRRVSICKEHNSDRCVEYMRKRSKGASTTSLPRAA